MAWWYGRGLSPSAFDAIVIRAQGRCELCNVPCRDLQLDHDHATNVARGLLCTRCNVYVIERATRYLALSAGTEHERPALQYSELRDYIRKAVA